jgi:hypothetical protein
MPTELGRSLGVPGACLLSAAFFLAPTLLSAEDANGVAKAVSFGNGRKDIPLVVQDDTVDEGVCEVLELASPALRVARVVRQARLKSRDADPADVAAAARPTLSVLYGREPSRTRSTIIVRASSNVGAGPSIPPPVPCPEDRKPLNLVLVARSGETLEPIQAPTLVNKHWKQGLASGTVFGAIAEFDLAKALTLANGKDLEVRVLYEKGNPSAFRFTSRQLADLTPAWAR